MHEYGFYVVVGGVPYRYPVGTDSPGRLSQEGIPHIAGCFLRGKAQPGLMRLHITPVYGGGNIQAVRKVGHVSGISFRFGAPQLVVEMSYVQLQV